MVFVSMRFSLWVPEAGDCCSEQELSPQDRAREPGTVWKLPERECP